MEILQIPLLQYMCLLVSFFFLTLEILTPGVGVFFLLFVALLSAFFSLGGSFTILWFVLDFLGIVFVLLECFFPKKALFFLIGFALIISGAFLNIDWSLSIGYLVFNVFLSLILSLQVFVFYLFLGKLIALKKTEDKFFNMIGQQGVVSKIIDKDTCFCKINGTLWRAKIIGSLQKGDIIMVEEQKGNSLVIKKYE